MLLHGEEALGSGHQPCVLIEPLGAYGDHKGSIRNSLTQQSIYKEGTMFVYVLSETHRAQHCRITCVMKLCMMHRKEAKKRLPQWICGTSLLNSPCDGLLTK